MAASQKQGTYLGTPGGGRPTGEGSCERCGSGCMQTVLSDPAGIMGSWHHLLDVTGTSLSGP